MDTKDKNRSAGRKRPASGSSRRSGDTDRKRQGTARRSEPETRRRPEEARRSETAQRRTEQSRNAASQRRNAPAGAGQQRRRPAEQEARRSAAPRQQVKSDAPEQVFRPAQEQPRRRDPQAAKRAAQRRQSAKRTKEREIQKKKQASRPAVEYTQPKPLNLNRLLLQIAVVLAVVLAVVMGLSVFFKVETVVVYGNSAYSAWSIQEAAGIEGGENLLTLNRTRASGKIIASLPYVESARIGIKLPDTVNIYIEEVDVAYAIESEDGTWWLMASSGNILEQIDAGTANSYTKIVGVELSSPVIGEQARALNSSSVDYDADETQATDAPAEESTGATDATDATDATEETAAPVVKVVTGQQRLDAALTILSALELNQIIGEAASVDVSDLEDLQLWYGLQYQVRLGDTSDMDYKISCMKAAIAQQKDYDMGILDVSFTQWPDQVGFTPAGSEE